MNEETNIVAVVNLKSVWDGEAWWIEAYEEGTLIGKSGPIARQFKDDAEEQAARQRSGTE